MKKRVCCVILTAIMLCMMSLPAQGADTQALDAALALNALGLFNGAGQNADGSPDFALDRAPTRNEAITMLVRLLGKEQDAKSGQWDMPFTDVASWARPYVGYAYANGLTSGTSPTTFGGETTVTAAQYLTFVLRALGYDSSVDFRWDRAWELSDTIGLTDGRYNGETKTFLRGDLAIVSQSALAIRLKHGDMTLYEFIQLQYAPKEDFSVLLAAASAEHKQLNECATGFDGFQQVLVKDTSTADLLSTKEIQLLLADNEGPYSLSKEQASADVDLLFRAFQASYGAYYYIGADAFDAAEGELMAWLDGKSTVETAELETKISEVFTFLRDAHTRVAGSRRLNDAAMRYEYFYCTGQSYAKDNGGYYRYIGTEKWYVEQFSNDEVRMAPTLLNSGELCYAPVLFTVRKDAKDSTVTLRSLSGKTVTQPLSWTESEAYSSNSYRYPDFKLLEENGIVYISERCFDPAFEDGEIADFIASAAEARDAELIIFDIRGNGGGNGGYGAEWIKRFSGKTPVPHSVRADRVSKLHDTAWESRGYESGSGQYGTFEKEETAGRQLLNDIPILVLVDDLCGSAGESMLNFLRSMENVLIVGSNSAGYQLGGNCVDIRLPNSGISASIGTQVHFFYSMENVDYKGYEPDVWCNPADALDAVCQMLTRYGLTDADTAARLLAATQATAEMTESATPEQNAPQAEVAGDPYANYTGARRLTLDFDGLTITPRDRFGGSGRTHRLLVCVDGIPASVYTVSSDTPELCSCEKQADGSFILTVEGNGPFNITVECAGKTQTFQWFNP